MLYELSQLAIGNLMRARARLVMTAGGVLVGTTAVILLIALTIGLQQAAEAGIGNNASLTEISVYPAYNPNVTSFDELPQLDIAAVQAFWRIPGVAAVIPMVGMEGGGEMIAGDYFGYGQVLGVDPSLLPYLGVSVEQGVLSLGPGEVLFGAQVAMNFYDPESENYEPIMVDVLTEALSMRVYQWGATTPVNREIDLNVVGVLQPGTNLDYAVLMPVPEVLELNEWSSGTEFDPETFRFSQITIRATSRETTNDVSAAVREMGYEAGGMAEFLNQLNSFFGMMRLMLGGVGGVALLVAAFGVANTMTMAILERTKEIGLMKAIGATDRDVLTVFLIEASLVGFTGGAAGVGLSYFLQNLINNAVRGLSQGGGEPGRGGGGVMFLPFDPSQIGNGLVIIPTELAVFAVTLATLVGLAAGTIPALRAARMLPVAALKSE